MSASPSPSQPVQEGPLNPSSGSSSTRAGQESRTRPNSAEQLIVLAGLKRSGNHAVANWLISMTQTHGFYNDIRTHDPFGRGPTSARFDARGGVELLLCSYEDRSLRLLASPSAYPNGPCSVLVPSKACRYVILLRDPYNLFASQKKSAKDHSSYFSALNQRQLWISYAREALGVTRYLGSDVIVILYNRWRVDAEYRKSIAERLGLDTRNEDVDGVPSVGGGSSFDGVSFNGRGSGMSTDSRWRTMEMDEDYRRNFSNPVIHTLAEQLFDLDDELRQWISSLQVRRRRTMVADKFVLGVAEPAVVLVRSLPGVYDCFDQALPMLKRYGLLRLLGRRTR